MKQAGLVQIIIGTLLLVANAMAAEPAKPVQAPLEMDWTFSGLVRNENGELFNYYFQMQRKAINFHAIATLIDAKSQEVLVFEESTKTIEKPDLFNWRVGQSFLQFNPINNSWVFGVKTKNKNGFNFKVDLLQAENNPESQFLRSGVELSVNQTGRLNGHVQLAEGVKEQFVTAPKAWFKQVTVHQSQSGQHSLTGILCQFDDGSGFYSVNLPEEDALRGAIAGWRDEQGTPVSMSQFVSVQEKIDNSWQVRIQYPRVNFTMKDILADKEGEKRHLAAGMTQGDRRGFCAISHDAIGER